MRYRAVAVTLVLGLLAVFAARSEGAEEFDYQKYVDATAENREYMFNILDKLAGYKKVSVVNVEWDQGLFLKSVQADTTRSVDEALKDLYQKLRPGDPPTTASARPGAMLVSLLARCQGIWQAGLCQVAREAGNGEGSGEAIKLKASV